MATEVKFCGLTRGADAAAGSRFGAAYLGVIFAGGPRVLTPEAARAVLTAGTGVAGRAGARRVGVFGHQPLEEIGRVADEVELDIVQLHADPGPSEVSSLRRIFRGEIWAVLRVAGTRLPVSAGEVASAADAVVIDAHVAGSLGGTGRALDWRGLADSIAPLRAECRLVVAGGLSPENVASAVTALRPDVVDVSSGVESSPGIKDQGRMRAFAGAVGVLPREQGER